MAACSYLPGLIVGFLICGSVVLKWPKGELYFGANQMSEMWSGFASGSFDELNPNLVNPLLLSWLTSLRSVMPWVVAAASPLFLCHVEMRRWRSPEPETELAGNFVRLIAGIFLTTLLLHWLVFEFLHIPLPKDRTGLFFLPLWTLALVGSVAIASNPHGRRVAHRGGTVLLLVAALYFLACLRIGYFKEWKFDSDTKTLYWIMDDLHQRCRIEKFGIDWRYQLALNFYREVYRNYSLSEFSYVNSGDLPVDRDAYAIFLPTSEDFIERQHLHVIYRNDESNAAVAVRGCPANAAPAPKDSRARTRFPVN